MNLNQLFTARALLALVADAANSLTLPEGARVVVEAPELKRVEGGYLVTVGFLLPDATAETIKETT